MKILAIILFTIAITPSHANAQEEDTLTESYMNAFRSYRYGNDSLKKVKLENAMLNVLKALEDYRKGEEDYILSKTQLDSARAEIASLRQLQLGFFWQIDSLQVLNIILRKELNADSSSQIYSGLFNCASSEGTSNWIVISDDAEIRYFIIDKESDIAGRFKKMSPDKLYHKLLREKNFMKIYSSCKHPIEFEQRTLSFGRISCSYKSTSYLPRLEFLFQQNTLTELLIAPDLSINEKEFMYLGPLHE